MRRSRRGRIGSAAPALLALVGAALAGCGGDATESPGGGIGEAGATEGSPAAWSLSAEPLLEIGVLSGEEEYQLHDVRDGVRLPDGRLALAHQGSREVRVYGPDGTFLVAQGEEGDGPGQWRALARVEALGGDTLMVEDRRLRRHAFVRAGTGEYLGEADSARAASFGHNAWFHDGLILETPPDVRDPGVLAAVVERLDVLDPSAPAFVRLDPEGRVWVSGAPSAAEPSLRLFDLDGRERAVLPLPTGFRPVDVGDEHVLGVWRDSLDVEFVRLHALEGRAPWSGPGVAEAASRERALPAASAAEASEVPELAAAFRRMAGAQEINYSQRMSYTSDLAALSEAMDLELPAGARVDILEATPEGWRARAVDPATGAGCALAYGFFHPVEGMPSGAILCWSRAEGATAGSGEPAGD